MRFVVLPHLFEWHDWFAWYPVQIERFWVWGEVIRRVRVMSRDTSMQEVHRWAYKFPHPR